MYLIYGILLHVQELNHMKQFDLILRQSNNFIESAFAQEYSEQEIKTMEFIISQTTKADIELTKNNQTKTIEIAAQDFAKMINANIKQIYRDAKSLANSLTSKKYHFQYIDESGKFAFETGVFLTSMGYSNGVIKMRINPFVLPYFVEIKERFTEFNLRYLIAMGSSYGIKLYKLLKQYQTIGDRTITVSELRQQFGINEEKYSQYGDLKRFVIDIAIKHINNYTDIQVRYEEIKLSRKIHKLKFYIIAKMTQARQAKIAFITWAQDTKTTKDEHLKMLITDSEKHKKDPFKLTKIQQAFEWFLINKVSQYDPNSCAPLQYFGRDTLFGN